MPLVWLLLGGAGALYLSRPSVAPAPAPPAAGVNRNGVAWSTLFAAALAAVLVYYFAKRGR